MKKMISVILAIIMVVALTACNATEDSVSDEELINTAMELSKEENNYTFWLFSQDNYINDNNIIQIEFNYTLDGKGFHSIENYVPVSEFENVKDFVNSASKVLSAQYVENYLYQFIGLHPTKSIPFPILLEQDGRLYKALSINGVSKIPNIKYASGEVLEKTGSSAIVRLYVDPSVDTDITFIDYPLLLEDDVWKHNPPV